MKIVVVGAGKLGYDICKILSEERHDVIVIDKDPQALEEITRNLDVMTVVGNGAGIKTLKDVGIESTDMMLAVTDNDELNMIACMTAKQFGVGMTVARVRNPDYTPSHPMILSYNHFGIDLIINPEYLAAQEVFRLIEMPMASDIDFFADGKLSMIGLRIDQNLAVAGKQINELGMKTLTVVAIVRQGKTIIPGGRAQLLPEDRVYMLGRTSGFHALNGLLQRKKLRFNRIVIGGISNITYYLAGLLQNRKTVPAIKIIDPSIEKCKAFATEFPDCTLICGDVTKSEVLQEEHLGPEDIFIALTGSDNANLVACLQAKHMGVKELICETTREDCIALAEAVQATATVTPRLLTASTLLKLVRRNNIVSVNLLHLGDAVIMELIAEPDSRATMGCLSDLNLPQGIVIGAIISHDKIIVPRGETVIQAGDHVVVSSLKSSIPQIENLFKTTKA